MYVTVFIFLDFNIPARTIALMTSPEKLFYVKGLSPEEMGLVKGRASELKVERDVTEERLHPLLERRNELTYGRLFLERSASSFEV